ncbi:hypothetical protein ACFZC3_15610 [Streptomyces sp. NPDC007903]|uniref:hypothetical protein n=1 Tax=Streptomyces sp. NPDC007903 TaxID=3364786 RepID=UPI0036E7A2E1
MLQAKLLETADEGSSLSISLNVSGGLVCGQLITRDEGKRLWHPSVGQADEQVGEILVEVDRLRAAEQDVDQLGEPSRFVHLKDAIFVSGTYRQSLGLWRGPLAHIAGWSNSIPE